MRHTEMLNLIKKDARLWLTETNKQETIRFIAKINWVEDRGDSLYFGYTPEDGHCAWGNTGFYKNEIKPYGIVMIEPVIAKTQERNSFCLCGSCGSHKIRGIELCDNCLEELCGDIIQDILDRKIYKQEDVLCHNQKS